jgi:hypothetical protein
MQSRSRALLLATSVAAIALGAACSPSAPASGAPGGATGGASPACGHAGTSTAISDNGAAGNKYCPLVSATDVASAFGQSGVTGPVIVSSETMTPVSGTSVEEASCYYYANGSVIADIGYTYGSVQGTAQVQYSIAQSTLMSAGCTESTAMAGQQAFVAMCPECDAGTSGALLTVLADTNSVVLVWGVGATQSQEEALAQLVVGRLP